MTYYFKIASITLELISRLVSESLYEVSYFSQDEKEIRIIKMIYMMVRFPGQPTKIYIALQQMGHHSLTPSYPKQVEDSFSDTHVSSLPVGSCVHF